MFLRTGGPPGEVGVFKLLFCAFCSIRTLLTEGFDYEIALCFHGNTLARQLGSTFLCLPAVSSWSALITGDPVSLAHWVMLKNKSTHYLVWRQGRFAYFPQENFSKKVPCLWGFQATAILELFGTQFQAKLRMKIEGVRAGSWTALPSGEIAWTVIGKECLCMGWGCWHAPAAGGPGG